MKNIITCISYEEYFNFTNKYKSEKIQIISDEPAIEKIDFTNGKYTFDVSETTYEYSPFGELKCEEIILNRTNFLTAYNEHSKHNRFSYLSKPRQLKVGFICYCKVNENKSLHFLINLMEFKNIGSSFNFENLKEDNSILLPDNLRMIK